MEEKLYIKYLVESVSKPKRPLSEQSNETAISIVRGGLKKADSVYKEKIKACKGGLFKRGTKNPQECFLKAKRSSFRQAISYLKENVHRCENSGKPGNCKKALADVLKGWQSEVDKLSSQLENM
jgi:hypothetical protein